MTAHLGIARMEAATIELPSIHLSAERARPFLTAAAIRLAVAALLFAGVGALMVSDQINQPPHTGVGNTIHWTLVKP